MALSKEETEKLFNLYLNFDKRVRHLLAVKKMKPKDLAKKMDIQPSAVYRVISMGGHPDMWTLMKMADAFEISVDQLIGLKELK